MSLLFDSSALLNLIRMIGGSSIRYLRGNYVLSLTPYEIGNAVWKEATLLKTISINEALALLQYIDKLYSFLRVISPSSPGLVLRVAHSLRITYYDSSYIVAAAENELVLVTDDEKLAKRIRSHSDNLRSIIGKDVEVVNTERLLRT